LQGYQFTGDKTEVVKEIGNAVPRKLARAIVAAGPTQNPDAPETLMLWEEGKEAQVKLASYSIVVDRAVHTGPQNDGVDGL
jgi:hypothetical protein